MARTRYQSRRKKKPATVYRVNTAELTKAVSEILETYCENITDETKKAIDQTADETERVLHNTSPARRKREYANAWTWDNILESPLARVDAVYNEGRTYKLIHLLEWGHIIRNQRNGPTYGRVEARPHVMPAKEYAEKIYTQLIKEAIKNAAD